MAWIFAIAVATPLGMATGGGRIRGDASLYAEKGFPSDFQMFVNIFCWARGAEGGFPKRYCDILPDRPEILFKALQKRDRFPEEGASSGTLQNWPQNGEAHLLNPNHRNFHKRHYSYKPYRQVEVRLVRGYMLQHYDEIWPYKNGPEIPREFRGKKFVWQDEVPELVKAYNGELQK